MNSLFAPMDFYCERLDTTFWSEPLNAITNAAFLIASWLLYRQYKQLHHHSRSCLILICLIALVGVGSFSFHTFGTYITMFADIIPIICFVCCFLVISLRSLLGLSKAQSFAALIAFLGVSYLMIQLPREYSFNGSASYFGCLFALLVIGAALAYRGHPAKHAFLMACLLFTLSITFRSIDMSVCEDFVHGTHFLWHICNGMVLYILTRTLFAPTIHTHK